MCKAQWTCRGIPQANILSERLISVRRKSGVFCRQGRVQSQLFGNFTVPARTWSNHNIVLTYKFQYSWRLNFAGTGSWILLTSVSSCRRVIPSLKIALNSNREISYRELARRSCILHGLIFIEITRAQIWPLKSICTLVSDGIRTMYVLLLL